MDIILNNYKHGSYKVLECADQIYSQLSGATKDGQVAMTLEATKLARKEFDRFLNDLLLCVIFKDKYPQSLPDPSLTPGGAPRVPPLFCI